MDALVGDAYAALGVLEGRELTDGVAQAADLLGTVIGQDIETRADGTFAIAGRAARLECQHRRRQPARLGFDYVHQMVDDRTRLAYAEIHHDDRGDTAAAFTDRAIAWFAACGVTIERAMTDNNSCDRSRPLARSWPATAWPTSARAPIDPRPTNKVERRNLTLTHEWADIAADTSNQQRRHAFNRSLHSDNSHRPHSAHGGKPPMAALTGNNAAGNHN